MSKMKLQVKRARPFKVNNEAIWGYIFVLPILIAFAIFTLYPVINAFIVSFQKYKPLGVQWVGVANYITTFKSDLIYKSLWNTVLYTVITVPLSMFLSFAISIMILPFTKKQQSFFKAVYYLPAIASGVALSFVWKWIYDPLPTGLLNSILRIFGIQNLNWLGNSKTSMLSLIIMALFSGFGQTVIIYIAALIGIDTTYYEAADIDGASFLQKIRYIVWPMIKPTTVFLAITGVINSFQVFQNAYLMTGGGPNNSTTMVGLLIFNKAFKYFEYGEACAQALLLAAIIAIFAVIQFKITGEDVEY